MSSLAEAKEEQAKAKEEVASLYRQLQRASIDRIISIYLISLVKKQELVNVNSRRFLIVRSEMTVTYQ